MAATILLVDDEARMRDVLGLSLRGLGFQALTAANGEEAIELLRKSPVDLVLTDLRMPRLGGEELLQAIRTERPGLPVVVMTAYGSVRDAVRLTKAGALDYLVKPFEAAELEAVLRHALRAHATGLDRAPPDADAMALAGLIGASAAIQAVRTQIGEVRNSRSTVLITGESGTGKDVIARAIHASSPRRERPFVPVNCAAIPDQLLESELFGHVRGAFTGAQAARVGRFEQAEGGTLFLDEIGDMPLQMQAKILRVLQDRTVEPVGGTTSRQVDVRVIAATNQDLATAIAAGRFRADLFYRLNVYPIVMPPLRERPEDVPLLAQHFLERLGPELGSVATGFTEGALRLLRAHSWPGNVRELQNCIERAALVAKTASIGPAELPLAGNAEAGADATLENDDGPLDETLASVERQRIERALASTGGVQVRAAALLGITERSLWHRIKKLGIQTRKGDG
jgi:DNA-binding NtrC family response regulator